MVSQGYGYEITGADVWSAYFSLTKAAENVGRTDETLNRLRDLVEKEGDAFVADILRRNLNLSRRR